MPARVEQRSFAPEAWRGGSEGRIAMAKSLRDDVKMFGQPQASIEELLGPADGRRVTAEPSWELSIPCPLGMLNWDEFFYRPSETYPEPVERIGTWAYVHE
jgi:hypothetical protein